MSHWLCEERSSLQKQTFWCTHLTTHTFLSPSPRSGWGVNTRLWLLRDLRPCPVTPTLDPNKCWQAQPQARLSSCGTKGCFPNSPRQAVGREAPASRRRLFSTDHLGKRQIQISWLECKGCEMPKTPQREPKTLLPGRQWEEGWQRQAGEEQVTQRGCLSGKQEIGLQKEKKNPLVLSGR